MGYRPKQEDIEIRQDLQDAQDKFCLSGRKAKHITPLQGRDKDK
jgi:hypothetical protein